MMPLEILMLICVVQMCFIFMIIIDKALGEDCVWYERKGYYDRYQERVIYGIYKNTKECIVGFTCCSPGGKYCCLEYNFDDESYITASDVEDDEGPTMGFIVGITLAIAAVLFICSVFGRQLCKKGQASQNSSDASGSDQGLVNSSDRDHGSFVMHSSPTVSSTFSMSEDEESLTSSGKSLLHTHDDCKTFLTLLHARRHYPSEPPPPYQYVMRNKDKYPLRGDIFI